MSSRNFLLLGLLFAVVLLISSEVSARDLAENNEETTKEVERASGKYPGIGGKGLHPRKGGKGLLPGRGGRGGGYPGGGGRGGGKVGGCYGSSGGGCEICLYPGKVHGSPSRPAGGSSGGRPSGSHCPHGRCCGRGSDCYCCSTNQFGKMVEIEN